MTQQVLLLLLESSPSEFWFHSNKHIVYTLNLESRHRGKLPAWPNLTSMEDEGEFSHHSHHGEDSSIVDLYRTDPTLTWKQYDQDEDEFDDEITPESLERVRRKLGIVRLSWPDSEDLGDDEVFLKSLPPGYSTLSNIEKCLMWHAENFRKQFSTLYPNRKPLLLVCANECGVQVKLLLFFYW